MAATKGDSLFGSSYKVTIVANRSDGQLLGRLKSLSCVLFDNRVFE